MAKEKSINGGGGASTQSNSIDSKASVLSGYSLSTSVQTVVGAINEILPKATGVGKVDTTSDGTGEVFNGYEGENANVATGPYSHAEGAGTNATGPCSHAEGYYTNATGQFSHAEGYHTEATGDDSHAEGGRTTAEGRCSHAEGSGTTAMGKYSHAEGYSCTALGDSSHVEGSNNFASGICSHAEGLGTQAFNFNEHAEGSYNKSYSPTDASVYVVHSVGIGSSNTNRKNAHEIKFNGDHYIYGIGGYDGTNSADAQTLQTVITGLQASIRTRESEQTVYTEVPELTADYQIPANDTFVERVYIIPVGATLYSVTGDSSILWAGGIAPNPSANSVLVVSIVKNLATWNVFMPV